LSQLVVSFEERDMMIRRAIVDIVLHTKTNKNKAKSARFIHGKSKTVWKEKKFSLIITCKFEIFLKKVKEKFIKLSHRYTFSFELHHFIDIHFNSHAFTIAWIKNEHKVIFLLMERRKKLYFNNNSEAKLETESFKHLTIQFLNKWKFIILKTKTNFFLFNEHACK
jgi:hypothetical protein